VALKKSDLYSSLWKSCDELRGGMDASQYKDYILTLLFVKYVSDKAEHDPHSLIDVPAGGSFKDLVKLKGKPNIGEQINVAIRKLADANDLQGVINNADFDDPNKLGDGKAMQDRLSKLIGIFQGLDFSGSRAEGDDLLGDAYEYLMRHFATESGKSKGQFYTPAEVSRVMAQLLGISPTTQKRATVYDPTCGSGSLLLKVADAAPHGLSVYGQEKDNATWALCRMNMILHGNVTAGIRMGDSIVDPKFLSGDNLNAFDFLVANPPFSVKSWTSGLENEHGIFDGYVRPPEKNGDYAFLLHMVKSLKPTGKGVVVQPHGVLFRGHAEADIRTALIKRGYIKGIIGLPANLFYGTGIPACLLVLDKENADQRTEIFMIDASRDFMKDGPKNRLRPRDMHQIIDTFTKEIEIPRYSRMVPISEIADPKNDYNLNITRYIDSSEPEDLQDLNAHMHGGIPDRDLDALADYWKAFPGLRATLFTENRSEFSDLAIDISDVQQTILDSAKFRKFATWVSNQVDGWFNDHAAQLAAITPNTRPGDLIKEISEDLLDRFKSVPLLDEYNVYEQLMSYWNNVMHDDVFLIMREGWVGAAKPRKIGGDKDHKVAEEPDLVIGSGKSATKYKMDLVPPRIMIDAYYAEHQSHIDEVAVKAEGAALAIEEYTEEHAVEDGLLAGAIDDDKVTKVSTTKRLKEAREKGAEPDEIKALQHLNGLYAAEADAKNAVKAAQDEIDKTILKEYGNLTEDDVKSLVLEYKWRASVDRRITDEVDSLTLDLVERIRQLGKRYAETVGTLDVEIEKLELKVASHLSAMGIKS
jgi:type I restriction enzyme M protein